MQFNFQFIPNVNAAAGVLSNCFSNRKKIIAVDHLSVCDVNPDDWELVFVLCAETTFKIRNDLDRLGDKLVLIHTSSEPGLEKYTNFFFPYWLLCVNAVNPDINTRQRSTDAPSLVYNALMGRAKDSRTMLLEQLKNSNLLHKGIVSYSPGSLYGQSLALDPSPYYNNIWEWEEPNIQKLYNTGRKYSANLDSTTKFIDGYFSSCALPWKIYDNTVITIVAETDNIGSHSFLTEKTWKPFLAKHPVIFYATQDHEKFLESLGFEMYFKTAGDPAVTANIISELAIGGYGDYKWDDISNHNKNAADPKIWQMRLYRWLQVNFML